MMGAIQIGPMVSELSTWTLGRDWTASTFHSHMCTPSNARRSFRVPTDTRNQPHPHTQPTLQAQSPTTAV